MDFDVKTENFEKTRLSIVKLAVWLVYNAFLILYNGYRIAKISFQRSNLQESVRNERLKKENRREDMRKRIAAGLLAFALAFTAMDFGGLVSIQANAAGLVQVTEETRVIFI